MPRFLRSLVRRVLLRNRWAGILFLERVDETGADVDFGKLGVRPQDVGPRPAVHDQRDHPSASDPGPPDHRRPGVDAWFEGHPADPEPVRIGRRRLLQALAVDLRLVTEIPGAVVDELGRGNRVVVDALNWSGRYQGGGTAPLRERSRSQPGEGIENAG